MSRLEPLPYGLERRIKEAKECALLLDKFLNDAMLYCYFLRDGAERRLEDVRKYTELYGKRKKFDCVKRTIKFLDEIDKILEISSTNTE